MLPRLVSRGEVGDAVADADVALPPELLLRPGEGRVGAGVLELEGPRHLARPRQHRLVLVVEELHRALLHRAGEDEGPVRPAHQRQVEAEGVVPEELLPRPACSPGAGCALRWGKRPKRMMTATCRWKISWKAFSGSSGARLVHRPAPFLHAEMLVLERLGMGEREAEEDALDRPEARADPDPEPALDEREAARVAGVHLRRSRGTCCGGTGRA